MIKKVWIRGKEYTFALQRNLLKGYGVDCKVFEGDIDGLFVKVYKDIGRYNEEALEECVERYSAE